MEEAEAKYTKITAEDCNAATSGRTAAGEVSNCRHVVIEGRCYDS